MTILHPEQNARIEWEIKSDGKAEKLRGCFVKIWILDERNKAVDVEYKIKNNNIYCFDHIAKNHRRAGVYTLLMIAEKDKEDDNPRIIEAFGAYAVAEKKEGPAPEPAKIEIITNLIKPCKK